MLIQCSKCENVVGILDNIKLDEELDKLSN